MKRISEIYIKASEAIAKVTQNRHQGQTMTEYALILAAVAIVAYVTYQVMGQDIGVMVNKVDSALSTS
jgi:Flp pilus assembly pilin Flp